MKFKIRFADQIVGFFVLAAIVAVAVVLILIGVNQRWFAKNYYFTQRVLLRRRASFVGHADQPQGLRHRQDLPHVPERPERGGRPLLHRGHLLRPREAELGPGAHLQPHRPGHHAEVPLRERTRCRRSPRAPSSRAWTPTRAGSSWRTGKVDIPKDADVIGSVIAKLNPILDETRLTIVRDPQARWTRSTSRSTAAAAPWATMVTDLSRTPAR